MKPRVFICSEEHLWFHKPIYSSSFPHSNAYSNHSFYSKGTNNKCVVVKRRIFCEYLRELYFPFLTNFNSFYNFFPLFKLYSLKSHRLYGAELFGRYMWFSAQNSAPRVHGSAAQWLQIPLQFLKRARHGHPIVSLCRGFFSSVMVVGLPFSVFTINRNFVDHNFHWPPRHKDIQCRGRKWTDRPRSSITLHT